MTDLKYMQQDELIALQHRINAEMANRRAVEALKQNEKNDEEFRNKPEVQAIKERLVALEAEFKTLPQEFNIGKTLEFKLSVGGINYMDVSEILDNSCEDILQLSLECTNADSLPEDLKYAVENIADNFSDEYFVGDELLDGVESYQWNDFIKRVKKLEEDAAFIYEYGISPGELLEE